MQIRISVQMSMFPNFDMGQMSFGNVAGLSTHYHCAKGKKHHDNGVGMSVGLVFGMVPFLALVFCKTVVLL